jgi:hypothetical protein
MRNFRIAAAFLWAPLCLALSWSGLIGALTRSLDTFCYIFPSLFVDALGRALVLGVPSFLILRRRRALSLRHAMCGGALMGALPFNTLYETIRTSANPPAPLAMAGHIIDVGEPLWQSYIQIIIGGAVLGAACGAIWWLLVRSALRGANPNAGAAEKRST